MRLSLGTCAFFSSILTVAGQYDDPTPRTKTFSSFSNKDHKHIGKPKYDINNSSCFALTEASTIAFQTTRMNGNEVMGDIQDPVCLVAFDDDNCKDSVASLQFQDVWWNPWAYASDKTAEFDLPQPITMASSFKWLQTACVKPLETFAKSHGMNPKTIVTKSKDTDPGPVATKSNDTALAAVGTNSTSKNSVKISPSSSKSSFPVLVNFYTLDYGLEEGGSASKVDSVYGSDHTRGYNISSPRCLTLSSELSFVDFTLDSDKATNADTGHIVDPHCLQIFHDNMCRNFTASVQFQNVSWSGNNDPQFELPRYYASSLKWVPAACEKPVKTYTRSNKTEDAVIAADTKDTNNATSSIVSFLYLAEAPVLNIVSAGDGDFISESRCIPVGRGPNIVEFGQTGQEFSKENSGHIVDPHCLHGFYDDGCKDGIASAQYQNISWANGNQPRVGLFDNSTKAKSFMWTQTACVNPTKTYQSIHIASIIPDFGGVSDFADDETVVSRSNSIKSKDTNAKHTDKAPTHSSKPAAKILSFISNAPPQPEPLKDRSLTIPYRGKHNITVDISNSTCTPFAGTTSVAFELEQVDFEHVDHGFGQLTRPYCLHLFHDDDCKSSFGSLQFQDITWYGGNRPTFPLPSDMLGEVHRSNSFKWTQDACVKPTMTYTIALSKRMWVHD